MGPSISAIIAMKPSRNPSGIVSAILAVAFLTACQTEQVEVKPAQPAPKAATPAQALPPAPPPETPEQIAEKAARAAAQAERDSVVSLYNNGDYYGAIKRATTVLDDLKIYKDLELDTLKYSAFSYCLVSRTALCRQQFEKALKLDPAFTLEAGEIGHPLWWPVFLQAKKKEGIK